MAPSRPGRVCVSASLDQARPSARYSRSRPRLRLRLRRRTGTARVMVTHASN
jgi:hypothetical protein